MIPFPDPENDPTRVPGYGMRKIITARTKETINAAAKKGFWPVIVPVTPSPDIHSKFTVFQNPDTGEIMVSGDFRCSPMDNWVRVIEWTHYYPHHFPRPYAAYLVPPDIAVGETVWIKDLIEDIVQTNWNQGDAFRLMSCSAVWTGEKFQILFDPEYDGVQMVG